MIRADGPPAEGAEAIAKIAAARGPVKRQDCRAGTVLLDKTFFLA